MSYTNVILVSLRPEKQFRLEKFVSEFTLLCVLFLVSAIKIRLKLYYPELGISSNISIIGLFVYCYIADTLQDKVK